MVSQVFNEYSRKLTLCLMTYQFLEVGLKFCLHRCHATIKYRLDGFLHYEAPVRAVEDAALGRLIEWYKGFTTNQSLITELRAIKRERDRVAHEGYVLTSEEQRDDAFLTRETEKLDAAHKTAKACLESLHAEMQKTDEVINAVYAQFREKKALEGQINAPEPVVEGLTDAPSAAP